MPAHDELVQDPPVVAWNGDSALAEEAFALESIQRALYGAVRFAQSYLEERGVAGAQLSRLICTPDARHWTLGFGESFFEMEALADGFSVRSARPLRREA